VTAPAATRSGLLRALAAAAVLGALVLGTWYGYRMVAAQPIRQVAFAGDVGRLDPRELEALERSVRGAVAGSVSLAAVREAARRIPWVRDAGVRRRFPATLEITFEAYEPLARWGERALVSGRGEVFTAEYAGKLPRVSGPDGSAETMARELPRVERALAPVASPVAELRLSPRGAWQVVLDSGLVLELGRGDIETRLARFARAWPQLAAHGVASAHADLRYANGFALRRAAEVKPVVPSTRPAGKSRKK
jgi:cell division protein FtsQ